MNKMLIVVLSLFVLGLAGCSTQVIRKDVNDVVDLSGRWNDTDARMVAEEMVKTCTDGKWIAQFNKDKGRDPVVIVGTITNRSHEHINARVFTEDLEMALVNSGKVKFVAAKGERAEVREERAEQQEFFSRDAGQTCPGNGCRFHAAGQYQFRQG